MREVTSAGRTRVQYAKGARFAESTRGIGVVACRSTPVFVRSDKTCTPIVETNQRNFPIYLIRSDRAGGVGLAY